MSKERLKFLWFWLARWMCKVFCILFFRLRSHGKQNIPERGGFVLACNHQSFLDPIFCGVPVKRHLDFLARDTLFNNWFFGSLISSVNSIPVKRDRADVSTMKEVIARLRKGRGVCLFPEGKRSSDGRIEHFKPGFGLLCRRGDSPVIPVLVDGAFECWPRHKMIFSPGVVNVYYSRAITAEQIKNMSERELAELVTQRLRRMQNDCRIKRQKKPFNYSLPNPQ